MLINISLNDFEPIFLLYIYLLDTFIQSNKHLEKTGSDTSWRKWGLWVFVKGPNVDITDISGF